MGSIVTKLTYKVDDHDDMVRLKLGSEYHFMRYRTAFEIEQSLRVAAKEVMRRLGETARKWYDDLPDNLDDRPSTHRGFRESNQIASFKNWSVCVSGTEVQVFFDGSGTGFDADFALHLHWDLRRAARRAKAWAGDTSRHRRLQGYLTDANAV
jgi:hypothetical protein